MCGICGVYNWHKRQIDKNLIHRMTASLSHRGPDDDGSYFDTCVGLGHRRLSIIDLVTGVQPLSNEDGSIWIVFNGEIYNFQTLREELENAGHIFRTQSDTEAIVHCYEAYGVDCLQHLRGMFAFALWDARKGQLMLARDRLGQKPLFYAEGNGELIFASEIQGLLQVPSISREVDFHAIDLYLTCGYIPAPYTAFKAIRKLPPASYLIARDGKVTIRRYWDLVYTPKLEISEEEACERLLELLKEAVELRMISDVPLGAFLSGGIDSSAVVALMSQLSEKPVKTFSIGFEDAAYNELDHARTVAERFGTDHHEFIVQPKALEILPTLVRHYGEPYADSSAIPTFYVSKLTRGHVTVALNGDGGDESFAGYERYLANQLAAIYQKCPTLLRKTVEKGISALPGHADLRSGVQRFKRFCESAGLPVASRYLDWVGIFNSSQKGELYTPEFLVKHAASLFMRSADQANEQAARSTSSKTSGGFRPLRRPTGG